MNKKPIGGYANSATNLEAPKSPVVTGYGTSGQDVSDKLANGIDKHNKMSGSVITLEWRHDVNCFVLKNSAGADKVSIHRIIEDIKSVAWKPVLAERRAPSEDFTVQLKPVLDSRVGNPVDAQYTPMSWSVSRYPIGSEAQSDFVMPSLAAPKTIKSPAHRSRLAQSDQRILSSVFKGGPGLVNTQTAFIKPSNARGVFQGEAGVTSAESQKHLIGSYAANPCVIVAVFHPVSKRAALAHIDSCADAGQAIGALVSSLTGNYESKDLDVHLASGALGENNEVERELKQFISYHKGAVIRSEHKADSLAIDAKDGRVYTGVKFGQLDDGDKVDLRLRTRRIVMQMAGIRPKERLIMLFEA
jgi:hypothetical protein